MDDNDVTDAGSVDIKQSDQDEKIESYPARPDGIKVSKKRRIDDEHIKASEKAKNEGRDRFLQLMERRVIAMEENNRISITHTSTQADTQPMATNIEADFKILATDEITMPDETSRTALRHMKNMILARYAPPNQSPSAKKILSPVPSIDDKIATAVSAQGQSSLYVGTTGETSSIRDLDVDDEIIDPQLGSL